MLLGSTMLVFSLILATVAAFDTPNICNFVDSYPKQYVAYHVGHPMVIDGKLDDSCWDEVPFTSDFVDISTNTVPRFNTKAKIRWDDDYLYVGAILEETEIWANITDTCHCYNNSEDQVIFHDNDFEVFLDLDGNTHHYKEYEMNVMNATWDLILNKPYSNDGYENSSRVYGKFGFDMQPPLTSGVFVNGSVNEPYKDNAYWSVEIAFPIAHLAVNESISLPPKNDSIWRINFSRVEWGVDIVNNTYIKNPSCQSCAVPGTDCEDNWVWSPMGEVNMHSPEKWGILQLSRNVPSKETKPVIYSEWPIRSVAMVLYHAEHSYFNAYGRFTTNLIDLDAYAVPPILSTGECVQLPSIELGDGGLSFVANITDKENIYSVSIQNDRLMTVL